MNIDWQQLGADELVTIGYRKLLKRTYKLPNQKIADYYVKKEGPSVCMLVLTSDQKVVIAEQFRVGPNKVLLELPGGGINPDEEPLAAAKRELLEETGYSGDFEFIGQSLDDAYSTQLRSNFVVTNAQQIAHPQNDDSEFINVHTMSLEEFRAHLRSGQLSDIETGYLGLDYLGLL